MSVHYRDPQVTHADAGSQGDVATEPYFDDGTVQLWHGDCREVTAWLAADVLVTDPPYGRDWGYHGGGHASNNKTGRPRPSHDGIPNDQDTSVRDAILAAWGDRPALVFGDLMLPPPHGTKQVLIYEAAPGSGVIGSRFGWRRNVQAIYLLGRGWPTVASSRSAVLRTAAPNGPNLARVYGHPHAKPVDVMEQLIGMCPPGAIADPCAGGGSTLFAARNLGRLVIGAELKKRYCKTAARRLSQGVLDLGGAA